MPLLKFLGFPTGSDVEVSATQGAETTSASVEGWGEPASTLALSIATRRSDIPAARHAPEGIAFEAIPFGFEFQDWGPTTFYDPAFHEISYEWDFGDQREPWAAPRLPEEFNEPSRGFGKTVGHVFTRPGTYEVRCTARQIRSLDPVEVWETSAVTVVTIADPDAIFSPAQTLVCDFTGGTPDFTDAPPGNRFADSSSQLEQRMRNILDTHGRIRVRLKVGDNRSILNNGGARWLLGRAATDVVRVDSWGGPGKAVVTNLSGREAIGPARIVTGLHVMGAYDPDTGLADRDSPSFNFGGGLIDWSAGYRVYHDLEVSNVGIGIYVRNRSIEDSGAPVNYLAFVDDVYMHDKYDYAILMDDNPGDFWSFAGLADIDAVNQLHGPLSGKFHSGLRTLGNSTILLDGCDIFSRKGWSPDNPWSDGELATAEQPCLRIGAGYKLGLPIAPRDLPRQQYVTRCVFEGGRDMLTGNAVDQTFGQVPANIVYDGNIIVAAPKTVGFFEFNCGATTIRANLAIKPDTSEAQILKPVETHGLDGTQVPWSEAREDPVQVYSNTFVFRRPNQAWPLVTPEKPEFTFPKVVEENNVVVGPGANPAQPSLVDYEFDDTILFAPRYAGRRLYDGQTPGPVETEFATPPDSISWHQPIELTDLPATSGPPSAVALFDVRRRPVIDMARVGAHYEAWQAPFGPPQIFAPGDIGVLFDPGDISTLYQNLDGPDAPAASRVPVAQDGDPVGCVVDLSGNGFHLKAESLALRPVFRTNGSLNWIEFTGDRSTSAMQAAVTRAFRPAGGTRNAAGSFVVESSSTGSNAPMWTWHSASAASATARFIILGEMGNGSGNAGVDAFQASARQVVGASSLPGRIIFTANVRPDSIEYRENGVARLSGPATIPDATADLDVVIPNFVSDDAVRFYGGLFIDRALSSQELSMVESFFASRSGISL